MNVFKISLFAYFFLAKIFPIDYDVFSKNVGKNTDKEKNIYFKVFSSLLFSFVLLRFIYSFGFVHMCFYLDTYRWYLR